MNQANKVFILIVIGIFLTCVNLTAAESIKLKGLGKVEVQAVVLSKTSQNALITTQIGDQKARYEIVSVGSELRHGYNVSSISTDSLGLQHEPTKASVFIPFSTAPVLPSDLEDGRVELYSNNAPLVQILFLLAENSGDNIIFTDDISGDYQREWTTRRPVKFFEKFAKSRGCKAIYKKIKQVWLIGDYSRLLKVKFSKPTDAVDGRPSKSYKGFTFSARNISLSFVMKKICQLNRAQLIMKNVSSRKKVSMRIRDMDYLDVINCLSKMYKLKINGPTIMVSPAKD